MFVRGEKQTCQILMTQTRKIMKKIVLKWGETKLKCSETVTSWNQNAAKAKYSIWVNRENKMQNTKLLKKGAKLKCHENILPLKYFFFIMTVNNINFFINTPDDMDAFYTLSSPKIVHITVFLLDTLLWRRDVYYEGKSKRVRIHL